KGRIDRTVILKRLSYLNWARISFQTARSSELEVDSTRRAKKPLGAAACDFSICSTVLLRVRAYCIERRETLILAMTLTGWCGIARLVRGQFLSLRELEYVEATRALGFGSLRAIFRHILPNTLGPITVVATANFSYAIIAEAGLSFLGFGVQPPTPSWGAMLRDGYAYIVSGSGWWLAVFPGLAIMIAVLAINVLGDGLRDALDPKLQK
ncbi:MAG: ABC transporter permease, partial [Chlorobiales bacterium]|nr:ABC transporter permease [Chlorobiales bacterium]